MYGNAGDIDDASNALLKEGQLPVVVSLRKSLLTFDSSERLNIVEIGI